MSEKLYNGIVLPDDFPPRDVSTDFDTVLDVPYLRSVSDGGSRPDVINVDVGRQLFVDDFLVDATDLTFTHHTAVDYPENPVLRPGTQPTGSYLKHGAVYYDGDEKVFRLWLNRDGNLTCFKSADGVHWDGGEKCEGMSGGYMTVVQDPNPKTPDKKYVCLMRLANGLFEKIPEYTGKPHENYPFFIWTSPDGVHDWKKVTLGGRCGDATTLFYNPFRNKWVASLRRAHRKLGIGRAREYFECDDITAEAPRCADEQVFWLRADKTDRRAPHTPDDMPVQIYALCVTAYESILLGAFQMLTGPENKAAEKTGIPKVTDIHLGYSRDGFHFDRPSRLPIISASQKKGDWKRGYLHPVGNVMTVLPDELRFYYDGYEGDESRAGDGYRNSGTLDKESVGFATMRRDGFVSLDGSGTVTTRKLTCTQGQKYLFVNAKCKTLRAEVLDGDGNVIPGYAMDDCVAFGGDSTCAMLSWKNGASLDVLVGTAFRLRFSMENGEFYAFWLSSDTDGTSNGRFGSSVFNL